MPIRHKSIYEPASPDDGRRVLVTRYWPRGVRKDRVDEYVTTLAPSRELLHAFRGGNVPWPQYRERYEAEMSSNTAQAELNRLRDVARDSTITVMCMCKDAERCHRTLLARLLNG